MSSEIVKQIRRMEGAAVVDVVGELTLRESPDFHSTLIELCDEAPDKLVVNLAEVPFIDSSGVGTLTDIFRRMKKSGGELATSYRKGTPMPARRSRLPLSRST